jgi:1,4-alpha-glucan branching enzyme
MLPEDIAAIVGGYHNDPFRVLGLHPDGEHFSIHAFLPQALEVTVCQGEARHRMEKIHPDGLYRLRGLTDAARYCYLIKLWNGREQMLEDPYRFGPLLSPFELHLHTEGTLYRGWNTLGAHVTNVEGVDGVRFAVWAPGALNVTVAGVFNDWDTRRHPMRWRDGGVWEIFLPDAKPGDIYKYRVKSAADGREELKSDPYAFQTELPPRTASVIHKWANYEWRDGGWLERRAKKQWIAEPMSIYEVHLESWMRDGDGNPLTYRQLARTLVSYVSRLGYTHIELMPILEHPYGGSWGYQVTGFFAPTSRFGSPADFKYFVDCCHLSGIGVILDWVPGHFPKDAHGLARFDGTALYEHEDPRQGEHRGWGTHVFNYGCNEVRSFLISNAMFWLEEYHIDGLRVDAVASMLYLDYERKEGEWIPNRYGGRENLEAIEFLKLFNIEAHTVPGAITIAEESTAFGGITRPVYLGGLGFTLKWNMGWMHDMFRYFKQDPIYRKFYHQNITFSLLYAFTENYLLPISHDEVVHGKSALIGKMPGDEWRRFANVRAFMAYMYGHPGKKLLFMGQEIGQYEEWNWQKQIRWELLEYDYHRKLQALVIALNRIYRSEPALFEVDTHHDGFQWIDFQDVDGSVISFERRAQDKEDSLVVVCNFTPNVRRGYRIGVPGSGNYRELLNTDAGAFGGSNVRNDGPIAAQAVAMHGRKFSVALTLPPLGVLILKPERATDRA